MVETALFILLGIFLTLLVMLMILPMIWRRAVRLTQKRILGEMPISHAELKAEKDMQRAELAIEQRRLEVALDVQSEDLSNSKFKVHQLNNTLSQRDTSIENHKETISDLEAKLATEQENFSTQKTELEETNQTLDQAREDIADLNEEKTGLQQDIMHLETSQSEQKVELVAQLTQLESLRQEVAELTREKQSEIDARSNAESQLAQRDTELDRSRERLDKNEEKLHSLQAELADKDAELASAAQRLERSKERAEHQKDGDNAARFAETEARRIEAEAKIAALTVKLESQQQLDEAGNNAATVIEDLNKTKRELETQLSDSKDEISALEQKLDELRKAKDIFAADSKLSPKEHQLRSEIKNIAAKIAHFSLEEEGDTSPIPDLMKDDEPSTDKPSENKSDGDDPLDMVMSLASRIKAFGDEDKDDNKPLAKSK